MRRLDPGFAVKAVTPQAIHSGMARQMRQASELYLRIIEGAEDIDFSSLDPELVEYIAVDAVCKSHSILLQPDLYEFLRGLFSALVENGNDDHRSAIESYRERFGSYQPPGGPDA